MANKKATNVSKKKYRKPVGPCVECGEVAYWRGKIKPESDLFSPLCPKHYMRLRRHGHLNHNNFHAINDQLLEYIKEQVDVEGRTFVDIAKELGIPRQTIQKRYSLPYVRDE